VHLVRPGLQEAREAQVAQLVLELAGRVLRQQDGRLLADEVLEVGRVEVVPVQVGDVQVVAVAEGFPVEERIIRKGKP
jgi:hypothetical protein